MSRTDTSILSVRVSAVERELLEAAAGQKRSSLSDFVRRSAIEAAELETMERRIVTIPPERWEEFEAWLGTPAQDSAAIQRLAATQPVWDR